LRPIVGNRIVVRHMSNIRIRGIEAVCIILDGVSGHLRLFIVFAVEGLEFLSIGG